MTGKDEINKIQVPVVLVLHSIICYNLMPGEAPPRRHIEQNEKIKLNYNFSTYIYHLEFYA